jgi:hypothetical protein
MLSPDVITYVWLDNLFCLTNSDILLSDSCTLEIPLDPSQNNNDPSYSVIPKHPPEDLIIFSICLEAMYRMLISLRDPVEMANLVSPIQVTS